MSIITIPYKGDILEVLVDENFCEEHRDKPWRAVHQDRDGKDLWYFIAGFNGRQNYMHTLVAGASRGQIVDHKNHNHFDNRSSNLRIATRSQNAMNKLKPRGGLYKFKGVTPNRAGTRYTVCIIKEGIEYTVRSFKTEEEAARAYNELAKWLHGDYASLNDV